jgi:3-oxoacyl-[acyl-carrier-protein] synthase-3
MKKSFVITTNEENKILSLPIQGMGKYLPDKVITNSYYETTYGFSSAWIKQVTGIEERREANNDETPSTMGAIAAQNALINAGMNVESIDLIISASMSGDFTSPPTACLIQNKLGAKNASAFDIPGSCTGFVWALNTAALYVNSGQYNTVLVVATDAALRGANKKDKNTLILLGDGAAAVIMQKSFKKHNKAILSFVSGTDGAQWEVATILGGGAKYPCPSSDIGDRYWFNMKGKEIYRLAVLYIEEGIKKALNTAGLTKDDIDLIIPHQANIRILQTILEKLDIPSKKMFVNMSKYGNTAAASIAIALVEAVEQKRLKKNDIVVVASFGAGFSWAISVIKW